MAMDSQIEKFFSDAHRRSFDRGRTEGRTEGKAEGKAEALLMVLRRRGMVITAPPQQQIVACGELATLERWLDRAFTVDSVDELLG
jgi:predicted transposase YdaD